MPYERHPPTINNQKPVNIFYVWYTELCRRLNSNPAPVVKPAKPKCQTVLNFVADRLKVEEWNPVINALRHDTSLHVIAIRSRLGNYQFLHEVDTEEKVRQMKRRSGSLWTAFILKSLLKSLSCTIRNTQVLTCLEFDGLPIFAQYLEPLMKALQKNKTLKNLTLSRCRITDAGCQIVCAYVRFAPNIEVLNLSACLLTSSSGEYLAKLVKYQQINRYCETWHNSLRYSDPNVQVMRGLKRITLNSNPLIGDDGLEFILNELDDDLWIKALDMQNCGITENMALRIIDLVQYSQSLEIADFRMNDQLSDKTVERVLDILKQKFLHGNSEFQWCNTSFSIAGDSVLDTISNYASTRTQLVHKSKSTPFKQCSSRPTLNQFVRRAKTSDNITKQKQEEINEKVYELSNLLQEEIAKRKETEKVNEDLKKKLSEYNGHKKVEVNTKVEVKAKTTKTPIEMLSKICNKNGGPHKNGVKKNGVNGFKRNGETACKIFEKMLGDDRDGQSLDDDSLLDYLEDKGRSKEKVDGNSDMTESQISLIKFMENLKNGKNVPINCINHSKNVKYFVTDKHLRKKT